MLNINKYGGKKFQLSRVIKYAKFIRKYVIINVQYRNV